MGDLTNDASSRAKKYEKLNKILKNIFFFVKLKYQIQLFEPKTSILPTNSNVFIIHKLSEYYYLNLN